MEIKDKINEMLVEIPECGILDIQEQAEIASMDSNQDIYLRGVERGLKLALDIIVDHEKGL